MKRRALLEDGRIIERGTHESLMQAEGVYYRMVRRQMHADQQDIDGLESAVPVDTLWR